MEDLDVAFAVKDGYRLTMPSSCPPFLSELAQRCWSTQPEQRPDFTEIWNTMEASRPTITNSVQAEVPGDTIRLSWHQWLE